MNINPGGIISHAEMCVREKRMLQHGMNCRASPTHSVILMSQRRGAPYDDLIVDSGRTLIYEGHDVPRTRGVTDPKKLDQAATTPSGRSTANGQFEKAAKDYKAGLRAAEQVRVYEKIRDGIWAYNGVFELLDVSRETSAGRMVFKFKLRLVGSEVDAGRTDYVDMPHNRLIPAAVKQEVYKRDKGKCVICGRADNLHFDHDFPYSKGGSSISAKNIKLLCARHNLTKRDRIE